MLTIDRSSPVPIYTQIEQLFEGRIFEQRIEAHEALPSAPALGEELGVSTLTVQKAYRRLQERGLIYSIAGKGTFVAKMKDRPFVAILVQNQVLMETSRKQVIPTLLQGIHDGLVQRELFPRLLVDTNVRQMHAAPISSVVMDVLRQGRVQGIVGVSHYGAEELFELAAERSIPMVSWGVMDARFSASAEVSSDQVFARALGDMKEAGIGDVGLMWLDRPGNSPAQQAATVQEFTRIFEAHGMTPRLEWIMGIPEPSEWAGYHAFEHMWELPQRPRGLIMLDDAFGRGVLMAMHARGLQAPADLRTVVASYEDTDVNFPDSWSRCEVSLTQCGAFVASLMRDLVDGKAVAPVTDVAVKWHRAVQPVRPRDGRRVKVNFVPTPRVRSGREVLEVAGLGVPAGVQTRVRPTPSRAY